MSSLIRCSVCRDVVAADFNEYMTHLGKHSFWRLSRALWYMDRRAFVFIMTGTGFVVSVLSVSFFVLSFK